MGTTIKDVARMAGCSIKTVSRVINNEPHVTQELRKKVQAAIRALGYSPNISARRLARNKAYMVCILLYPGFDPPAAGLLPRVLDIGYDENYDILFQSYFPALSRSRNKLVELIGGRRIDGFVSTPPCDADGFVADLLTTYKVPLVQIDPFDRSGSTPYVAGDDFQGARAMTEYLIGLGHRRIAFLAGARNLRSSVERLAGYRAALAAHAIPVEERLIEPSEFTFDGGYTAARLLLARQPAPDAIFAGHDTAAYGALFAAQEGGWQVPRQLSVCGFNDLTLSRYIWPGLTTVHQPADRMLEQAVRLLIDLLNGKPLEQREHILASRLEIRGSTAARGGIAAG